MKLIHLYLIALFTTLVLTTALTGCSSGDNGDTTNHPSYPPETDKLTTKAESSNDLYVEPGFKFENIQQTFLKLSIADSGGEPLSHAAFKIYTVPKSIDSWLDEYFPDAQLLANGITNTLGQFNRTLDLTISTQQLLIVFNELGFENKILLTIENNSTELQINQSK